MIPVATLMYELDMKLNKIATSRHQSIPIEDKIIAINRAQIQLIKQKLSLNNTYKLGLDGFKKRYDDLETLVQPHIPLPLDKDVTSKLNKFTSSINNLKKPYMFYIDCYVLADKGSCKDQMIHTKRIKHADLNVVLQNQNTKPSFEWRELPITVSDEKLEIYTDGTFTPTMTYLSYLRYPIEIDSIGYVKFDGSDSIDVDCELHEYLADELIDLTVQELAMMTENQGAVEYSQVRIQNNE